MSRFTLLLTAACLLMSSEPGSCWKHHSVTCEGYVAHLNCGEGLVISVLSADYGRHDKTTCSSRRPAYQLQNVGCSRLSDKVAERCNGKQLCSIKASNSEFGDPCVGTYKYLDVTYTCESPGSWSHEVHSVACEGTVANLNCGEGLVISVLSAEYGRHDKTTCSSGRPAYQLQNVGCSRLSGKVAERCNGKQLCSIKASNSEFGDPCVGTYKYLDVTYTCESPGSWSHEVHSVACEGAVANLNCGEGLVISVLSADYGRHDKTTCSSGRPAYQLQNVGCSRLSGKVAERCNGKQLCSIKASNSEFGDPCVGTYKYLDVTYTCESPGSWSLEVHSVACEGAVANLNCGEGLVIFVLSAEYGRHDKTTCSSGRPASQLQNVGCSRLSGKVAERCNGKQLCSIKASNSEFGDPCVGTYKYLDVTYTCESPGSWSHEIHSVACEGAVANLNCGEGLVISILSADYGRHDKTTCSSGRPAYQLQNVGCSRLSDKVAERCNDKSYCYIKASNKEFGDPCVGTYKYLEVTYICYAHVTG